MGCGSTCEYSWLFPRQALFMLLASVVFLFCCSCSCTRFGVKFFLCFTVLRIQKKKWSLVDL